MVALDIILFHSMWHLYKVLQISIRPFAHTVCDFTSFPVATGTRFFVICKTQSAHLVILYAAFYFSCVQFTRFSMIVPDIILFL